MAIGYKRNTVKNRELLLTKQPNVRSIIKHHLPILYKSVDMKETFNPDKTRIMRGFWRHKNLKDILSPAAFPTNKDKQVILDTSCKKCNKKCHVCRVFLLESVTITTLATSIKHKIKDSVSCKDNWVVYCGTCIKCQKQNVGSTVTEFYTSYSNPKSHINSKRKTRTLAKHLLNNLDCKTLKLPLLKKSK